jgi:hypothetical protein
MVDLRGGGGLGLEMDGDAVLAEGMDWVRACVCVLGNGDRWVSNERRGVGGRCVESRWDATCVARRWGTCRSSGRKVGMPLLA